MIIQITKGEKGKNIYHYGDIALDATQWADRLGIKRHVFTHWVKTHGLKNAVEGKRKEKVYPHCYVPEIGTIDPDFQNKQLINSLREQGLDGEELEKEFLRRAI